MAGHSKFANIKHRKAAQDKKRAGSFTKLVREVVVAAKSGLPEESKNPRLRAAVYAAKKANVPKDRIEAAIKKVAGGQDDENYEEARYEGYGPGGVAVIVDALTDNRNRTASDVRTAFSKSGGSLGESGSVAFMFERVGWLQYKFEVADSEAMFEAAVEAGADDVESTEDGHDVTCAPDAFNEVREAMVEKFGDPEEGRLSWKPNTTSEVDAETGRKVMNLVDVLEDSDDVQYVTVNADFPDELMDE